MNLTTERATDAPATPSATDLPLLDHERLDCYRVVLEFAAMVPALAHATRHSLRDQLERAAASICLNLAEGCGRSSRRDRLHFFSIAQGSAMECAAAIDLLRIHGHVTLKDATRAKHKITRVIQMLVGLRRA
ncbi:MAG: four helix bundle protein [Vicinamibacteria bacterium]